MWKTLANFLWSGGVLRAWLAPEMRGEVDTALNGALDRLGFVRLTDTVRARLQGRKGGIRAADDRCFRGAPWHVHGDDERIDPRP